MAMDQALREQLRYLELRLAGCEVRPELNREQIAAYRLHIEIARESRDVVEYYAAVESRGLGFATARAEWLDRYHAMGALYRSLGDFGKLQAARISYETGVSAADAADFVGHLTRGKYRAAPLRIAAETSESMVSSLIITLLEWAVESDEDSKRDKRATVASHWGMIRSSDPRCTWERMTRHPPYRHRIPFSDPGMATLGELLRQAVGPALCDEPVIPPVRTEPPPMAPSADASSAQAGAVEGSQASREPVPTAARIARAYHEVYDALDASEPLLATTRQVYERIFDIEARADSGPCFVRMMAESDIYCELVRAPLIARARAAIAHAELVGQPHVVAHNRQFIELLERSASQTELEYEAERQSQYLAVEQAWHDIVLRSATRPIVAALFYDLYPGDNRRRAAIVSRDIACALFGASMATIIRSSRVVGFLSAMLACYGADYDPERGLGVEAGEAGMGMGPVLRDLMGHRAERGDPTIATGSELGDHVLEILESLGAAPAPTSEQPGGPMLYMWGQLLPISDLEAIARRPLRPDVDLCTPII